MPEITTYRKNWIHYTDIERRVIDNVDIVQGQELFFRWEVSDGVYNILMNGTIEQHDAQSRKILWIKE